MAPSPLRLVFERLILIKIAPAGRKILPDFPSALTIIDMAIRRHFLNTLQFGAEFSPEKKLKKVKFFPLLTLMDTVLLARKRWAY